MKKTKFGIMSLIILTIVTFSSCGISEKSSSSMAIKQFYEQCMLKYENVKNKIDDAFKSIGVKRYSDYKKESNFRTDDEGEKSRSDFLEKISEELMTKAIENIEYTEKWSAEE